MREGASLELRFEIGEIPPCLTSNKRFTFLVAFKGNCQNIECVLTPEDTEHKGGRMRGFIHDPFLLLFICQELSTDRSRWSQTYSPVTSFTPLSLLFGPLPFIRPASVSYRFQNVYNWFPHNNAIVINDSVRLLQLLYQITYTFDLLLLTTDHRMIPLVWSWKRS